MRPSALAILLAAAALAARPAPTAAAVIAAGIPSCSLADAIRSANDDQPIGGCASGAGADEIQLQADVVVTAAEAQAVATAGDAALLFGGRAGLPDVTSELTIAAAAGDTIRRQLALGCDPAAPANAFRLLTVRGGGSLALEGIHLRDGCVVVPAGQEGGGGAVLASASSLVLRGGEVFGNRAMGADGDEADGNPAGGAAIGGAIAVGGSGASLVVDGTLLEGNSAFAGLEGNVGAVARGGAIAVSGGTVTIAGAELRANQAAGGITSFAGNGGRGEGGALWIELASLALADTVFFANQARGGSAAAGSAGAGRGGAVELAVVAGTIERAIFTGNSARGGIDGNVSGAYGGALYVGGGTVGVRGSLFEGNEAFTWNLATALGGAIHWLGVGGEITGCTFDANRAAAADGPTPGYAFGGALSLVPPGNLPSLTNSTFHANVSEAGDLTAAGSAAAARGGGLYLAVTVGELSHLTIAGNYALGGDGTTGADGDGTGGGLMVMADQTLDNVAFSGNGVLDDGGAFPEDCHESGGTLTSGGFNLVETPGNCVFDHANDRPAGTSPGLYPLGDYGCATPLPDGRCLPTMALRRGFAALDGGRCVDPGNETDARGVTRPVDYPGATGIGDYCDVGAFEAFAGGFHTVTPCRLADTRDPGDAPALASGLARTLDVVGSCGVPPDAVAVALNVTVTAPSAGGHVSVYPGGTAPPLTSTVNFSAGQTRANNAVLPLAPNQTGTLAAQASLAGGGSVHLIVDVVGWFE